MATLTIRNLGEDVKWRLRRQAANHNRSMEEEARVILRQGVEVGLGPDGRLGTMIRQRVEELGGGVDFDLPEDVPYEAPELK